MENIYLGVEKSIKDLQSIFENTDDKNEKLQQFNQEALKVFQRLESKSLKELESLKHNEEWENFSIAFYGETGAGKSTLIECLRMFFKEQNKKDQQERFKQLDSHYQKNHQNDERLIEQYDTEISDIQKTLQDLESKLISLKECNIFFKIFHFLTGNRKFKEISKCFQKSQDELNDTELKKKNYISEKQAILDEMELLQDGAIIGDGRSDFTLKTQSYSFQYNHQTFVLLDVPGIEGDEKKVIDQISDATQKAHAIFYVTKAPKPPQKGEERKEGTIEKIQKQLGSQTEVWTIFNKPITSPIALKDGLINESEQESLKILDKEMKGVLGKHYMGHKVVSAQAAFYGLAQALIPETDFDEKKQKFLKNFKEEELLNQSHFKPLAEFIAEELIKNSRDKIIKSNCNKALKVVEELQKAIKTTIEKRIDPMIKEMQEHQEEVECRLDRSKDKFISDLTNSAFYEIDQFKSDLREKMYVHIERKIEDEECKEIFKNELIQGIETLRENIKRRFKECAERFDEHIKEDIEQFKERIQDSLAIIERIGIDSGNFDFNTDFNTDSGIDGFALGLSIGGLVVLGIVNMWNPMGWAELGLAGFVIAIGIVKSVWGFFDSDYKKSQQRKEVDKNLAQICEKIAENVKSQIESGKKDALEKIEELKVELNDSSIGNYERMKRLLKEAYERLGDISHNIKTRSKQ
ncbi:GTPase [Helicobacter pylori]|uniref:GTPase n=1 Tax=Helicobacter pylori TaxID=210 RepID=UPI000412046F|nr:GTPase [Helicobacter pylori]